MKKLQYGVSIALSSGVIASTLANAKASNLDSPPFVSGIASLPCDITNDADYQGLNFNILRGPGAADGHGDLYAQWKRDPLESMQDLISLEKTGFCHSVVKRLPCNVANGADFQGMRFVVVRGGDASNGHGRLYSQWVRSAEEALNTLNDLKNAGICE